MKLPRSVRAALLFLFILPVLWVAPARAQTTQPSDLPSLHTDTTTLDNWQPASGKTLILKRSTTYVSTRGKSFGGSGMTLKAEDGPGTLPIIQFTQKDRYATFLGFSSSSHDNLIQGVVFDLGSTSAFRDALHVRGARQTLRWVWLKGGNGNGIKGEEEGTVDWHIYGGGSAGPTGAYFYYLAADYAGGKRHKGFVMDGVSCTHPSLCTSGVSHQARLYGLSDAIIRYCTFDNDKAPDNRGSAGMRIHSGENIQVISTYVRGEAQRIGPLNLTSNDANLLKNLRFDNCKLYGNWIITKGAADTTFANCLIDSGGSRALSTNNTDSTDKPVPNGTLSNCRFYCTNASGIVLSGDASKWKISGCTLTNPTLKYVDKPWPK